MPRFFLRLSYKGTAYAGWQIQENAVSAQEKLNHALAILLKSEIATTGCGRTDTGVHARQFYVHFDFETVIEDGTKFCNQLNGILPNDIHIQELISVANESHARFDATRRTYEYFISPGKNPFLKEFAMLMHVPPDLERMNEACSHLLRHGDFTSFSKSNTQVKTNVCHITKAEWTTRNGLLVFTISADRFLRGMVRAVVGTMIEVGQNKLSPPEIAEIIDKKDRSEAGASVPACGLYLTSIEYPYIQPVNIFQFPS